MLYEMKGQPGVPMDDVQEVSCYVKALTLGVARIREGHPISFRLLTEVHQVLMTSGRGAQREPGEFRRNQVWIGGHRADEATFIPPPAKMFALSVQIAPPVGSPLSDIHSAACSTSAATPGG